MVVSTDYGHTKAKSLIICGPNSIFIWDVDIVFVEIMVEY